MGVRRKPASRRRYMVTNDVRIAVRNVEWWESHWGGPDKGRKAWEAVGHRLMRAGPHRPEPWWAYESGVPDHLRQRMEMPDPRPVLAGRFVDDRPYREWEIERYEWLIQSGRLEHDEIEQARACIAVRQKNLEA